MSEGVAGRVSVKVKLKCTVCVEGSSVGVDSFSGVCKPLCKDGGIGVCCMVNADPMRRLNKEQVNIGEFWTFLVGHRELLVETIKGVLEEVGSGLGT